MDNIVSLLDFILPGIFILILKEYFELFLKNRFKSKWMPYVIWGIYWLEDYFISYNISLEVPYSLIFTILNLLILCRIIYRNSIREILLSVLFIGCVGCILEMLTSILLNGVNKDQFIGSVCSKIMLLIFIRIIKLMKKQDNYEYVSQIDWVFNILISLSSIYIIYSFYLETNLNGKYNNRVSAMLSLLLILLINILSFNMLNKIAKNFEILHINTIYKSHIKFLIQRENNRREISSEMQKNIHDFNNHLLCIKEYAEKENYMKIVDYVNILQGYKRENTFLKKYSGNEIIDYIISEKVNMAKQKGIKMYIDISIPDSFQCSDFDICIVLTNAIDNAIEALCDIEEKIDKSVKLIMRYTKSSLYICVTNPCLKAVNFLSNGRLKTTKKSARGHGIGLSSIKKAANKYNGLVRTSVENNIFKIEIILYM